MRPRIPILLFHQITPGPTSCGLAVSIGEFRRRMEALQRSGWHCIHAELAAELSLAGRGRRRTFAITFDDGYADFSELAHPVLSDLGFFATVFVVTGRIGVVADWDGGPGLPLLGADAIRTLAREGVRFGSHSRSHRRLTEIPSAAVEADLADSRAVLSDLAGRDVTAVAWPYGLSDGPVRRAAIRAGYHIGFSLAGEGTLARRARSALCPPSRDRLAVQRREVRGGESLLRSALRMGPMDAIPVGLQKLVPRS